MSAPKLWLTSMSSDVSAENAMETLEPIREHLDGTIYVLNDVPPDTPSARYLESVKGAGRVIHRSFLPRHNHLMNDTLFTELIEEGSFVLWVDPLERPMARFVSRIKTEIGPAMAMDQIDVIHYYGKPYLLRYRETMEYRNSPHWSLAGTNGRAIEWSTIEPDEKQVRWNVRPIKRAGQAYHWVTHYARYFLFPAGSNTVALGLDQWPPGDRNQQFAEREERRLVFRRLMRERGYPMTLDGLRAMLSGPLDEVLRGFVAGEKVLSDVYHLWHGRGDRLVDSHDPRKAVPLDPL